MKFLSYIKCLRVMQFYKNATIFAPLFFSENITNIPLFISVFLVFLAFSFASSIVYIVNDIADKEKDRLHPIKSKRPIASGKVSTLEALALACLLGVVMLFLLARLHLSASIIIFAYIGLNLLYSFRLKHIPVFDVFLVGFLFVLRILAGGIPVNIKITPWIIFAIFFIALLLAVGKRKSELVHIENKRKVLDSYTEGILDAMLIVSVTACIVFYALYCILGAHSELVLYSLFFVVLALLRYLYLNLKKHDVESIEHLVLRDKILFFSLFFWFLYMLFAFYQDTGLVFVFS
ncbi:MAG TPA: prenyltransferase [Candidatus Woesearchaeota archaeon]|nr:prenyltransferase [Candidatus Woesearchaeota archaeon]